MTPDLRLVAPAVSLWLAAALTIGLLDLARPLAVVWWLLAAAALTAAFLLRRRGRRGPGGGGRAPRRAERTRSTPVLAATTASVCLAAVALVTSTIAAQAPGRNPPELVTAASNGTQVTATVRTQTTPQAMSPGFDGSVRWRWRGTTESVLVGREHTGAPGTAAGGESEAALGTAAGSPRVGAESPTAIAASAPVTIVATLAEESARPPAFGTLLRVTGTITRNPAGEKTSFTISADSPIMRLEDPPWWLAWTDQVRERFAASAATIPGDGGALLPGLAIGDERAVPSVLDDAMKTSSLSHLTAVSGANCALVTAAAFFVSARVGLGRRSRVAVALLALAAFVALVTPGASVIRAATMAVVVLFGIARGRPSRGLPLLAIAVIVLLVHDPWLARDYGFALSVLATGGLVVLAGPLTRILSRWLPRGLALAVAVPLAAQLACQPVLIMLTPTLPLYGVVANLLAGPAAPVATLFGCLACLALPFIPGLGHALVWAAWLPSAWIAQVATTTSGLPGSALPWADGLVGVVLCAAALAAVAVLVLTRSRVGRGVLATAAASSLALGASGYLGMLGGGSIGRLTALPNAWQIAACDVGQGDALLIRDAGQVAMIDVGRHPDLAAACLDRLGIARIDLLVLTHFDVDHVGGLSALDGRVARAIVGEPGRDLDRHAIDSLRRSGAQLDQGFAGMGGMLGALRWRILWPPVPLEGVSALTGNPGSIVVAVDGRGIRSLFLGDLGEDTQSSLLGAGVVDQVDVVKVAHHGSADQSERLYSRLNAALALVSVGRDNGYGHPTPSALGMLATAGAAVARTDTSGLLLVSPGPEPGTLELWTERREPADAAAGTSATASIASRPASRDGGRPYTGTDRGGTWRHEAAAGRARARDGRRAPSSRSSPGIRSGRRPSSSSPARRGSSPTGPSGCCATPSKRRTRASRSATSTLATTRRGSCSLSRAPPCSASRD
nr:ComEC/Rec2 family competence protein [Leifsonia sp. Root227]